MVTKLAGDVLLQAGKILAAHRGRVGPATPSQAAKHPAVCGDPRSAFHHSDEVAEAILGPEAHEKMNVLRKDGADDHAYAGAGARDLYRRPDVGNRRFVDAADATPSVPDEIGRAHV